MNTSQLKIIADRIERDLSRHRISSAIEQLMSMAQVEGAPWPVRSQIERLSESYGFLRGYALAGVDDPSRDEMLSSIVSAVRSVSASILRHAEIVSSPKQYFGIVRFEEMQPDSSIRGVIEQYRILLDRLSLASFSGKLSQELDRLYTQVDSLADRLFNLVWTSYPLNADDANALGEFIKNPDIRIEFREQLLGAVMLGALEYFDEHRLMLLAEVYLSDETRLEMRALVCLAIAIWMNRDYIHGRAFKNVMSVVREKKNWDEDLKTVFLNLVRTRDTDRISRTMKEEVIPQMMKLRPEIFKKFSGKEMSEDISSVEDNPEWEDMLEKSGITDKLRELNDMQSEGGDVMLSTFAGLKGFSFFSNVAHWFIPFFTDQTDARKVLGESAEDLGEMIAIAPMLCDNDKYSIVFSIEQLPSANRRMMIEQFKAQSDQLAEIRSSMLNSEQRSRHEIANNYIHDLYRFFTLYRRKGEFSNPFAKPINLAAVSLLADDFKDTATLEAVSEFYFKRKYYVEALDIYMLLLEKGCNTASVYQKTGFCYQQLGDFETALGYYKKSELLNPDSQWTLKRIAQCLRALGRNADALPYYKKLSDTSPNDIGITLNLGHCFLATGDYSGALKCYYKVEYLDEKGNKALRPIAWCLFVIGDYEKSEKYYLRIFAQHPVDTDYLNRGHLMLALGEYKKASDDYRAFLESNGGDIEKLDSAVQKDMPFLEKAGIDPSMIFITIDAAQYPETKQS